MDGVRSIKVISMSCRHCNFVSESIILNKLCNDSVMIFYKYCLVDDSNKITVVVGVPKKDGIEISWGFCIPGCRRQLQHLFNRSQNMSLPSMSEDVVNNINTLNGQSLREYAVDAFRDKRIDLQCRNNAEDHFCTSGIALQRGKICSI